MLEKARAEAADSATHIIQCDGEDCGVFRLETRSSELWLDALFLLPERQRRGLGTELLAGVHAMSEELRLPTRLQVMSYSPARQYYERFGYAVTHEEGDILDMERLP
jgi:GNAT superfamily N-acetyltransferase